MTHDLSWRHAHRHTLARRPRKNRTFLWLTALLVAINVAVIAYHGDPRHVFYTEHLKARAQGFARPKAERRSQRSFGAQRVGASLGGAARVWSRLGGWLLPEAHAALGPVGATRPDAALVAAAGFTGPPLPIDPLAELRTPGLVQRVERVTLGPGRTVARALAALGVPSADIGLALPALNHVTELRHMRPTDVLKVRFDGSGHLVSLDVTRGPLDQIVLRRQADSFVAQRQRIPVDTVVQEVTGEVRSSLWEALMRAGEDPRLAQQLVDIFAYEVDFYSEVRAGDTFRLLVEKRYAHGQLLGYGDMLAAELRCGGDLHRAFLWRQAGRAEYFDETGAAMRKQLMRMPLQYGAVTSRFGRRRHPILGYTRAHNGTDYGVPIGTPVWSVGDGRVTRAGWHGGYGRLVEVSHANGWLSQYAHLSRIAVHVGQKVRQRQTVGLVGMTGLATGPHLHYGLKHGGHYVNSLAQHFERASSLDHTSLGPFQHEVARLTGEMDKLQLAHEVTAVSAVPQQSG